MSRSGWPPSGRRVPACRADLRVCEGGCSSIRCAPPHPPKGDRTNMGLIDKVNEKATALLEPGEQLHSSVIAQAGANPWLANGLGLLGRATLAKPRIIAFTDQAIVVMEAN